MDVIFKRADQPFSKWSVECRIGLGASGEQADHAELKARDYVGQIDKAFRVGTDFTARSEFMNR